LAGRAGGIARAVRILTPPGVFRPPSDCWLLAATLRDHGFAAGASVLDVFTGSGALAVAAGRLGARRVTAVDVSRRAALTARLNGRLNGVRVDARRGDMFAPVAAERFDVILANPPYVPGEEALPGSGPARAWEGGGDGRLLLDRLCREAPDRLAPGGALLIVHSSICGERATLEALRAGGLAPEVLARRRGPLGPLMRARAPALERRGLLRPGEREEEMLVFAGRRAGPGGAPVAAA
jgi:release factor glutamine methyltransferase